MNIRHIDEIENIDFNKPFAIYQYDEVLSQKPGYVDIRGIVQRETCGWLDNLQKSHSDISRFFASLTRWWWVTPMSRLDLRPWGQEYVAKPLFFARAIIEWKRQYPDQEELQLCGVPSEVVSYLKQCGHSGKIKKKEFLFVNALKLSFLAFLKMLKQISFFVSQHMFRKHSPVEAETLAFYDITAEDCLENGHRFYYGKLFDHIDESKVHFISVTNNSSPVGCYRKEQCSATHLLFDYISFRDLIAAFLINVHIIFGVWVCYWKSFQCNIDGVSFKSFWNSYLFHELNRAPCFSGYLTYCSLKRILKQGNCRKVVYPYEEKGMERAILFSCSEANVKTIGYTPHPQHRLTLALRDVYEPISMKPSLYAVCGDAYIEYFKSWGRKSQSAISLWGSGKSFQEVGEVKQCFSASLKVLLLISHPNELKIFKSWLKSEKKMSEGVIYSVRLYKALACKKLALELKFLTDEFPCVVESQNDLNKELQECDIAAFCGTSAGVVAVKKGCLAVHVGLDDFFSINPCFDKLEDMLNCQFAKQFADLLGTLRTLDEEAVQRLYEKQKFFVDTVFSSIRQENLQKDIIGQG